MADDPIVTEIRRIREGLSEPFGFDTGKIFADMRKRQAQLGPRLIKRKATDRASQKRNPDQRATGLRSGR